MIINSFDNDLGLEFYKFYEELRNVPYYEYVLTGKVYRDKMNNKYVEAVDIFSRKNVIISFNDIEEYRELIKGLEKEGFIFYVKIGDE